MGGTMTARRILRALAMIGLIALVAVMDQTGARSQGPDELVALRAKVSQLFDQGKYDEAIPTAERYVALARQKHGEESPEFAAATKWLGIVYRAQGRYAEA